MAVAVEMVAAVAVAAAVDGRQITPKDTSSCLELR